MSGRGNKTPPELRILRNDKAHAHRDKVEEPSVVFEGILKPPETLAFRAKEIFKETVAMLEEEYQLSQTDLNILVLYSNNQEQLEALETYLRENGLTYTEDTQWGYKVHKRPEVIIHEKCKTMAAKFLDGFKKLPKKKVQIKGSNPFAALG